MLSLNEALKIAGLPQKVDLNEATEEQIDAILTKIKEKTGGSFAVEARKYAGLSPLSEADSATSKAELHFTKGGTESQGDVATILFGGKVTVEIARLLGVANDAKPYKVGKAYAVFDGNRLEFFADVADTQE